jgi:hypothetical protein
VEAELLLSAAGSRRGREPRGVVHPGGVGEEFHVGDLEGEAGVALAADVGCGLATDRDQAGAGRRGAVGAGWDERARSC